MKSFYIISIQLIAFSGSVFSQCPSPGLEIQTPICDSPKNLTISAITSSAQEIKWQGNNNQTYTIKVTYSDPVSNNVLEATTFKTIGDNNGNCVATIPVREGMKMNYSIQSICFSGATTLYSYKLEGKEVDIPVNQQLTQRTLQPAENTSKAIRVYPNPSTGNLTVEYYGKGAGKTEFKVFDITGKMVFQKWGNGDSGTSTFYHLDLHMLAPGSYLLKAIQGSDVNIAKFIIFRE